MRGMQSGSGLKETLKAMKKINGSDWVLRLLAHIA